MESRLKIKHNISSEKGSYRKENQDRGIFFEYNEVYGFVICDGMGGHYHGNIASYTTTKIIKKSLKKNYDIFKTENKEKINSWYSKTLSEVLKKMNSYCEFNNTYYDMGTTVLSVFYYKNKLYIFNVGDSRLYIRNKIENITKQITVDQTLANISKEGLQWYLNNYDINVSNAHNILYSALGPNKKLKIDFYTQSLTQDSTLVMTTDGIHDFVTLNTINYVLSSSNNLLKMNKTLLHIAINNQSLDNMSSIIVNFEFKHE